MDRGIKDSEPGGPLILRLGILYIYWNVRKQKRYNDQSTIVNKEAKVSRLSSCSTHSDSSINIVCSDGPAGKWCQNNRGESKRSWTKCALPQSYGTLADTQLHCRQTKRTNPSRILGTMRRSPVQLLRQALNSNPNGRVGVCLQIARWKTLPSAWKSTTTGVESKSPDCHPQCCRPSPRWG